MKLVRCLTGIVFMLVGVAGLVFSSLTIWGVQQVSTAASRQTEDILDSTKEGVGFLRRTTTKVHHLLGETKSRTKALDVTLADIADKVKNNKDKKTLHALHERIGAQLQRAQTTIATLQSNLEGIRNALGLFNSLSKISKSRSSADRKDEDEIQVLSHSLTETSETLDQISHFLDDVLTDREITQTSLNQVTVWVQQVESKLADAENRVDVFRQRLIVTEERVAASQQSIPSWIERGGQLVIVLLICFAFTQIGLMLQGWRMLRKSDS
jgi:chromosome segregation ATPase